MKHIRQFKRFIFLVHKLVKSVNAVFNVDYLISVFCFDRETGNAIFAVEFGSEMTIRIFLIKSAMHLVERNHVIRFAIKTS